MAIIHRAVITPSKPEFVEHWLDRQPWGGSGPLEQLGSYRFDDPDGQVGVEAILLRRGDVVLQAALTYRPAPLDGADDHLITTVEHSVLGRRWVYDAIGDPVAIGCFHRALNGEQQQAELEIWEGDKLIGHRDPTVSLSLVDGGRDATGSHDEDAADSVGAAEVPIRLARRLAGHLPGSRQLVAIWNGGEASVASIA